jgi:hypothetical protein
MATTTEVVPVAGDVLAVIAAAAADPRVDPAKLEVLLSLKERIDAREAERQFNEAFARLVLRIPRVSKKGKITLRTKEGIDKGELPFARWEDIDYVIRPLLADEGFALSFSCESAKDCIIMTGHLTHKAGHERRSTMQLPPDAGPGRNQLQAIGSSHSYGKRYITIDLLNIISEGADNDGSMADPLTEQERSNVEALINEIGLTEMAVKSFLRLAGAPSVEMIQRHRYQDIMQALRDKLNAKRRAGK